MWGSSRGSCLTPSSLCDLFFSYCELLLLLYLLSLSHGLPPKQHQLWLRS